ncbi:DUF624 domain-containing protein [Vallitaleaceae bacterium 9-2]
MKIFDLDGPFQRYGTIVFDVLVLNIVWLLITVFSFGILSGPALTGLYSGMYAGVVSGEGYPFKQFFKRFGKRFLTSLLVGLFTMFFVVVSLFNIFLIWTNQFGSVYILPFYLFVFIEISFISTYAFPLLAHSNLKFLDILKNSFLLANKHLPWTVVASLLNTVAVIVIALIFLGAVELFVFMFFGMGIIVWLNSIIITKKILTQYDNFINVE